MKRTARVVCLGHAAHDLIYRVPAIPAKPVKVLATAFSECGALGSSQSLRSSDLLAQTMRCGKSFTVRQLLATMLDSSDGVSCAAVPLFQFESPPVTRKTMTTLMLHDARAETKRPDAVQSAAVGELCRIFERSTGWSLMLRHTEDERPGFVLRVSETVERPVLHRAAATALATAFCGVVAELDQAQAAVWQREAELAAGVPISSQSEPEEHLAGRLEAVLAGGAQAVDCQAAALYLLDEATSQLKLRACWGLPREQLL